MRPENAVVLLSVVGFTWWAKGAIPTAVAAVFSMVRVQFVIWQTRKKTVYQKAVRVICTGRHKIG